jgi:peptidoglycan/LPS O-acetylase OafA/YrhL
MKVFYLPGLNGVRAIACLMVFYTHINSTIGTAYGFPYHGVDLGAFGVTIFFSLSGFLITTLLLQEKKANGKINFKKFYTRRILRIWPLYYLVVLLGFFGFLFHPQPDEKLSYFLYYIFFIGNYAFMATKAIWSINPLWSVGVEEQFYAMWPFLIRSKKVIRNLLLFIFIFLLVKLFAKNTGKLFYYFLANTGLDCMAIGGVLAYLRFTDSGLLKFLFNRMVQTVAWLILALSLVVKFHIISFLDQEIYSFIAGIVILNVSYNGRSIISLENKPLNYIGKISFGIYAYHMFIIFIWTSLFPSSSVARIPFFPYLVPFILLAISILISHLSYFHFEKRFLMLKDRFSIIKTVS